MKEENTPFMSRKTAAFLLMGLVIIAAIIRFWNLSWGLPGAYHSDEGLVTYYALNMCGGYFNAENFSHPHFYYYLCFLVDLLYIAWGFMAGVFQLPGDVWKLYVSDPTPFFVVMRAVSAFFGVLTIPVVYLIGKRMRGRKAGILAAFFMTFCFLHIQWSQVGYMDAPLAFWIMLAFLFSLSAFERKRRRDFILSGLFCGFAASTKYQGVVTLLWIPLGLLLHAFPMEERGIKGIVKAVCNRNLFLFFLFVLMGFSIGTPYWILDFPEFKRQWIVDVELFLLHKQTQLGAEKEWSILYYITGPLWYGLGAPLLLGGAAGIVSLLIERKKRNFLFLSFPVIYFLIIGISKMCKSSYVLPIVPFLCIAAAVYAVKLLKRFDEVDRLTSSCAMAALALLIVLAPIAQTALYFRVQTEQDTRLQLGEWVQEHIPEGSCLIYSFFLFNPDVSRDRDALRLDPTLLDTREFNRSTLKTLQEYRADGVQYIFMDGWFLNSIMVEGAPYERYQDLIATYRVFMEELKEEGMLIKRFSPYDPPSSKYMKDNLHIPSRDLKRMCRPGPNIWVYKI